MGTSRLAVWHCCGSGATIRPLSNPLSESSGLVSDFPRFLTTFVLYLRRVLLYKSVMALNGLICFDRP